MMSFISILFIFSLTLPSLGRLKLDMLSSLSPPLLSFAQWPFVPLNINQPLFNTLCTSPKFRPVNSFQIIQDRFRQ